MIFSNVETIPWMGSSGLYTLCLSIGERPGIDSASLYNEIITRRVGEDDRLDVSSNFVIELSDDDA